MSAINWTNECIQFKHSHKPGWLASMAECDRIINVSLIYLHLSYETNVATLLIIKCIANTCMRVVFHELRSDQLLMRFHIYIHSYNKSIALAEA